MRALLRIKIEKATREPVQLHIIDIGMHGPVTGPDDAGTRVCFRPLLFSLSLSHPPPNRGINADWNAECINRDREIIRLIASARYEPVANSGHTCTQCIIYFNSRIQIRREIKIDVSSIEVYDLS